MQRAAEMAALAAAAAARKEEEEKLQQVRTIFSHSPNFFPYMFPYSPYF
jgi:hypothetical protein